MKSIDVIKQLHAVLPLKTGLFTTNLDISSVSVAGDVVTVTTTTDHNLTTNDYVTMYGLVDKDLLVSLTQSNGVASAETTNRHDLTYSSYEETTVTISGSDQSEYNGEHELLDVANRKNFEFAVGGDPVSPSTGSTYLNYYSQSHGFNGYKQITIIDSTSFSYTTVYLFGTEADFSNAEVRTKPRISGAISVDRVIRSYEKMPTDDLWAFVVLNDAIVSKNRFILSDATDISTSNTDNRQKIIQDFDILIFKNSSSDLSGRYTRDLMEDLLLPICRTIIGVKFPSLMSEAAYAGAVFVGHEFKEYSGAYYAHVFRFETVKEIVFEDTTFSDDISVAFRDIHIDYYINDDQEINMTSDIDLDSEQL